MTTIDLSWVRPSWWTTRTAGSSVPARPELPPWGRRAGAYRLRFAGVLLAPQPALKRAETPMPGRSR